MRTRVEAKNIANFFMLCKYFSCGSHAVAFNYDSRLLSDMPRNCHLEGILLNSKSLLGMKKLLPG
jgi:hypothetical protein